MHIIYDVSHNIAKVICLFSRRATSLIECTYNIKSIMNNNNYNGKCPMN